jgi:hypothetical protein
MSTSHATKPAYEVGFGKPPKRTRFQPRQSGNRSGRPKMQLTRREVLQRALEERVVVTENGSQKTITKLEAVLKQLVNRAAGGDAKATRTLLPLIEANVIPLRTSSPVMVIIEGNDAKL